ncbi:MAG: imidazole glycerol phosphate synthase subunit HisH [Planctomycetes bacterium]|nr:imidazole glycerol phosphate synthase subunit HisH [Planctomycetota bacterium]MBI3835631.1 imidazole glycerol phosphate synthase subunit HisH [Planctomycetota bacterium]
MAGKTVAVLRTGVANVASVLAGLRRAGADACLVDDARSVEEADQLVLPGVGSFEAAMTQLRSRGLVEPLAQRVCADRSTLGICLGMQLLGSGSEESPNVAGLGVFPERATRFDSCVRVPQLGWNFLSIDSACRLIQPGCAYFANSYRFTEAPVGWRAAWSDHGGRFVAALERGSILACQFHPELSGAWGVALLRRWVTASEAEVVEC